MHRTSTLVLTKLEAIITELRRGVPRFVLHKVAIILAPYATLLAVTVALISLGISLKSGGEMQRRLTQLNASFDTTGMRLAALPGSIGRFDSTVTALTQSVADQDRKLGSTMDTLSWYVDAFAARLVNYKEQLDKIVAASDRQLELLSQRQKLLELELGRKSDLSLSFDVTAADSGSWQVTPTVENRGNAPSEFFTFFFDVPHSLGFQGAGYAVQSKDSIVDHVTFATTQPTGLPPSPGLALTASPLLAIFVLRNPPLGGQLKLEWVVAFQHGTNRGTSILKLGGR
jgi:hypothetical protein